MSNIKVSQNGDPGKLAYFRNPNFQVTPQSKIDNIDPRVCPGCLFPYAMRKHEHVNDKRCRLWEGSPLEVITRDPGAA